jgi:hypothetical protein
MNDLIYMLNLQKYMNEMICYYLIDYYPSHQTYINFSII